MQQKSTRPGGQQLYTSVLFQNEKVLKRIESLAANIIKEYKDQNPLFVCLLRGGAPFAALLMFSITRLDPYFHPELDYMTIRTYGDKRRAKPPELIMNLSPHTKPKSRPVLILDDVLDTGETAEFTAKHLLEQGAAKVDLWVLVQKQKERPVFGGSIVYGFEAPSGWLTGMGLDDTRIAPEANRWADYIALANSAL